MRKTLFSTLPFEAVTLGFDTSYSLLNWFALGVDTTFNLYDYSNNLKDHKIQFSTELMGEFKFSLGDRIEKSYRKDCYRFSFSLLGGGALYTNFNDLNLAPGGGLKMAVEIYRSSPWVAKMVLRGTVFYMQQVDSRYNSIDATISCGFGVSWNSFVGKGGKR